MDIARRLERVLDEFGEGRPRSVLLELGHDTFVDSSGLQVLSSSGTGSPNEIPAAFLIDGMSDCDERLLDFFGSLEHLVRQAESPD